MLGGLAARNASPPASSRLVLLKNALSKTDAIGIRAIFAPRANSFENGRVSSNVSSGSHRQCSNALSAFACYCCIVCAFFRFCMHI